MTEYVWKPLTPVEVAGVLAPLGVDWWIAGGVAIDLFVGHDTREHGDIDIAILRRDVSALRPLLGEWDVCIADKGALIPWNGATLPADQHQFWVRRRGEGPWAFEVLLEVTDGDDWIYRRNGRIRRPVAEIGTQTPDGRFPYLAPEVCLLYKSPRGVAVERNEADFKTANPLLRDGQRSWLLSAIKALDPSHPWITQLSKP